MKNDTVTFRKKKCFFLQHKMAKILLGLKIT